MSCPRSPASARARLPRGDRRSTSPAPPSRRRSRSNSEPSSPPPSRSTRTSRRSTRPSRITATTNKISVTTAAGTATSAATLTVILRTAINELQPGRRRGGLGRHRLRDEPPGYRSAKIRAYVGHDDHPGLGNTGQADRPRGSSYGEDLRHERGQYRHERNRLQGPPRITGFSPGSAPRGTIVDITGDTFTTPLTVKFGTVVATTITVDPNESTIHATVPDTATTNKISVSTAPRHGDERRDAHRSSWPDRVGIHTDDGCRSNRRDDQRRQPLRCDRRDVQRRRGDERDARKRDSGEGDGAAGRDDGEDQGDHRGRDRDEWFELHDPARDHWLQPVAARSATRSSLTGVGFLKMPPHGWAKFGDAQVWNTPVIVSDTQVELVVPPGATDGPISISTGPLGPRRGRLRRDRGCTFLGEESGLRQRPSGAGTGEIIRDVKGDGSTQVPA